MVKKQLNEHLDIEGVLLTLFDARLRLSNQVVEEVRKYFGKNVFRTIVTRNVLWLDNRIRKKRLRAVVVGNGRMTEMAKGVDIQDRLVRLGVGVMSLCDELPSTVAGKHFAGRLLRRGTSAAPNYAEARGAESVSDFVHKLESRLRS